MAKQRVYSSNGNSIDVDTRPVVCPVCGTKMTPEYLCIDGHVIFSRCSSSPCKANFLLFHSPVSDELIPNHPLSSEPFSPIIQDLSAQFVKIYNEAFCAEQMRLMEICGVGYRKALEFLIKDYVIQGKPQIDQEAIKKMQLMQCIESFVENDNIKKVAKRAVWLGNDETHYVKKWEEKDVQDLKGLIRLTIWWIEQTTETERLLEDMPGGR